MTLPERPAATVVLSSTRTGLYLAGRPADLLLVLRRLTSSASDLGPGPQEPATLRQLLDALLPPA